MNNIQQKHKKMMEEFDEKFDIGTASGIEVWLGDEDNPTVKDIKDFLTNAHNELIKSVIEVVEGMKKPKITKSEFDKLSLAEMGIANGKVGFNQALSDTTSTLQEGLIK